MFKGLTDFIRNAVTGLQAGDGTCYRYKLNDRLAVFVGWSAGYGEEKRNDVIQDKEEPDYAINVGIKVWTSDDMWADYDWLNFPYNKESEVEVFETSVSFDEDYRKLANYLRRGYRLMKDWEMTESGLIISQG